MRKVVEKEVVTKHTIKVNRADLRKLLKTYATIPDHADIYIEVPGGGDWSNTNLDVSDDHPIVIRWEVRHTEAP